LSRRPGRRRGEERVELANARGDLAASGLIFWGDSIQGLRPWADLVVTDLSVLPEVARALGPGASIMVAYGNDATQFALRRKVPPQATPLGLALLDAGCRWFKDWYFPEGGLEGSMKLQGVVPLDEEHMRRASRRLLEELESWERKLLGRGEGTSADKTKAETALVRLRREWLEWADSAKKKLSAEI
jgi:hypothetical protein